MLAMKTMCKRCCTCLDNASAATICSISDAERDLISQIQATEGERLAAIEVRHMRPDYTPREALITVLTLRGRDLFRTPAGHILDENAGCADGKLQTL